MIYWLYLKKDGVSSINFDDVMNFSHRHNPSVYREIVAAQKRGSLIPFVGAGMSVFCGYKLWGDVLCELAEFIQEDMEDKRQNALEQIKSGAYQDAAQTILEAYPQMLKRLPSLISPDKINNCPPEKFQTSAVYVLPYLFQEGLVMTTNFDRVLETAYRNGCNQSIQAVTPNQQDRLEQLRQKRSLGLFKLHGDIGSDTVSIDDLIFTGEQYEKKYADGSPLVRELTRWFENRTLLFLGCSLNADRTMDVLKSVTQSQSGLCHYAILGCNKFDITKRLKEMDDLGIEPILYDNSDHNAVRVILERLLEDTDQRSYKKFWEASRVSHAAAKEERRLLFDADYFPFTGRKQELKLLEDFCASHEDVSWWAVTGPGGMGKSRLVYEFTNRKHKNGWQIERFEAHPSKDSNANSIEALHEWLPDTPRTIVVLDDIQSHMEQVRQWLNEVVHHHRSEKLRILLLEREGKDLNSSSWLGADPCEDVPGEWCHDKNFLCLEPMTNADLITIMDDYASAAGQKLNAELLLKTLERVDPKLMRPLYAVAIADARCQGKDPTHWNRKKVLDTLLDRELNFHFNRFKGMTGEKATKTLRSELKDLLARSCVCGFLFLDDAEIGRYPKLSKKMNDVDMDFQEFLEGLGILRTVRLRSVTLDQSGNPIGEPLEEEPRKVIVLSCPDLIKEHLVLNLILEGGKRELLFPQGWEQSPGRLFFLRQLLVDYKDRLNNQPNYWNTFFHAAPQNVLSARVYGNILWGYATYYPDDARVAIDRLAQLYNEIQQDPEVAVMYANGLVNLTAAQDVEESTETVAQLDKLYQNHPNIPEIAGAYANGLHNLTVVQDLKGCTETVARLYGLYQNHPDISEVVVEYAYGLQNLAADQDLKGSMETVAQLDSLYQSHSDSEGVMEALASCLANLALHQKSESEVRNTLARSNAVLDRYPNNSHIQLAHAKTWFNLTLQQCEADIPATIMDIENFLRFNSGTIPEFKEALDKYLSAHPDHAVRYRSLLDL